MTNVLTLDIDWVPDWMIEKVASILIDHNVGATWFVNCWLSCHDRCTPSEKLTGNSAISYQGFI